MLAARRDFVALYPATARALIRTLVDACAWLDSAAHRREAADWLASPDALGVPARLIAPRLLGDYGSGPFAVPPLPIRFHDGGAVNRPIRAKASGSCPNTGAGACSTVRTTTRGSPGRSRKPRCMMLPSPKAAHRACRRRDAHRVMQAARAPAPRLSGPPAGARHAAPGDAA